jgi:hypothetical protein
MRPLARPGRSWRTGAALLLSSALLVLTAVPALAEEQHDPPPPFRLSGVAAEGRARSQVAAPAQSAALYAAAASASAALRIGSNTNVIGSSDVVQQESIAGVAVNTCNPGKQTAQNETTVAVNGSNLVAGANDYRLYEASENRYDGSGGFYRSSNGGGSWTAGFLPGLVRGNAAAPGPYESAGDPAVAAGPANVFWYANLAFNRGDDANGVAVSRSADGGATWATGYVIQTSAADGAKLFNDKEWIAADPVNPNVAYVTWTQFHYNSAGRYLSSPIVVSKTTDGGAHWSSPRQISSYTRSQGSVVQVDHAGFVHVTFETFASGHDAVAYAVSRDGGATFQTRILAVVNDIPSPLPGAAFRTNSFPAFALDGSGLHVVWSNWNGTDADVLYIRSADGGLSWSAPRTIGGGSGDQFFPWVGAGGGNVYASWLNRTNGDVYTASVAGSPNGGVVWTAPATLSSAPSDVSEGNLFGYPNCAPSFIGDYTGIAVGADGAAHPIWTDIRIGNDTSTTADQDPYTAIVTLR